MPGDTSIIDTQAPSPRCFACQTVAASAWVNLLCVAFTLNAQGGKCPCHVCARTSTGVSLLIGCQLIQRGLVCATSGRLVQRWCIGTEPAGLQLRQDGLCCTCHATRRVDIFNANQPPALVGTRIQPARQCRDQRPGMQRPRGGGRKTTDVGSHETVLTGMRSSACEAHFTTASANSRPEMNASSTRCPRHQSPATPKPCLASHQWLLPKGFSVLA